MRKLAIVLSLSLAAAGQTTFTSSGGLTVSAPGGSQCPSGIGTSTIAVSGLSGTIASVSLQINGITAARIGAVNFQLESPGGQKMVVWRAIGSNTVAITGVNVTLTDSAAVQLPTVSSVPNTVTTNTSYRPAAYSFRTFVIPPDEGAAPTFSGCTTPPTYASAAPLGTATLGNTFNGLSPNGNWRLNMIHNGGSAAGSISITNWSITITPNAVAVPTSTVITSATNPSLTGSSVGFTATVTSSGNPVTTGTVTFAQGATTLAANVPVNASGQATASVSFSTEGIRSITATYNGTPSFGSSSGSIFQEVNNPTTLVSGRYCNTGTLTLPSTAATITPAVPYPSKIFITGASGSITNVKLYLNGYNHTSPLAVNLLLVSPDGRKFIPMSTVGGTSAAGPVDMVLSDAGSSFISTTALSAGTFLPTAVNNFNVINFPSPAPPPPYQFAQSFGTATFANTFGGAPPTTTWQLFAVTQAAGALGGFNGGWCIEPSLSSDAPTTTTVSGTPNNSFTVAPNALVTITAQVQVSSTGNPVTTGTVNFTQGLTVLGSAPVNASGSASITRTFTTEGDFPIVASYSGTTGTFGASSGTYTQIVIARTTQTGNSFCNPGGISIIQPPSIADTASPYPSRILVPTGIGMLRKLTVSLNGLTHAAASELDMLLVGPTNQNLVFLSSAGGAGAVSGANLVFDDAAASQVPQSSTITSGTFRPGSYNAAASFLSPAPAGPYNHAASAGSSTLALFNNTATNGTWQLFLRDKNVGSLGSIGSWCVNLDTFPDLVVSKSHTGNFVQGQTGAQFTITVSNTTLGATSGPVTVTETVPTGLTLTGMSGSGWTCPGGNTCTRSDSLAGNSSYPPITATFTVSASAPASVTNSVSVSGGGEVNTANNGGSDTVTIVTPPDLTITKVAQGSGFQQGGSVTYELTVTNGGAGSTTGTITVTDVIPTGLTVTSATGTNWSCSGTTTITCTSAVSILAGANSVITLVANIAANAPLSITNTATVSGGGETNSGNNGGSSVINVTAVAPDLTISKVAQGSGFQQGGTVTYNLTVTNSGNGPTTANINVSDIIPTGLTATSATGTDWTCAIGATVTCSRATPILAGANSVITLVANIAANAPLSITNTATVSGGGETNIGNNGGSSVINVTAVAPDLTISKVAAGSGFQQGGTVTYNLTVTNSGNGPTTANINVSDIIPTGLTATSATGTDWTCAIGATVTCSRATPILAGANSVITLAANIAANAPLSITNTATVSGGGETNTGNNGGSSVINVTAVAPDLTISKVAQGSGFQQGGTVTYSLTVTNSGNGPTTANINVSDIIPTGLTATSATGTDWTCAIGATVTCSRATPILAGANSVITLAANIAANAPSSITNTATVSGGGETNIGNNGGSSVINVTAVAPDLTISKVAAGSGFQQGGTVTYNLTVTNSGNGPTTANINVSDIIPTGLTATSATGTDWTCAIGATVTCSRATPILAGANSVITLVANIAANAPSSITNTATVGGGGETNTGNNGGSSVISVGAGLTSVTINVPAGVTFTFNSATVTGSQSFSVAPGAYTLSTTSPQSLGVGTQAVWTSWSDGGGQSHTVNVGSSAIVITGTFATQFLLTTAVNNIGAGTGVVAPGTGFQNAGLVGVTATPGACSVFTGWTGAAVVSGQVNLTAPLSLTANFSAPVAAAAIKGSLQTVRGTPQRYRQAVSVLNTTGATTDISIVLDTFGGGVSVLAPAAPTGLTSACTGAAGRAFYTVANVAPGAYGTVTFDFTAPGPGAVTYNAAAVAGAGPR